MPINVFIYGETNKFCILLSYKDKWKFLVLNVVDQNYDRVKASIFCLFYALSLIKKNGYHINVFSNDYDIINYFNTGERVYESDVRAIINELSLAPDKCKLAYMVMKYNSVQGFLYDSGELYDGKAKPYKIGIRGITKGMDSAQYMHGLHQGGVVTCKKSFKCFAPSKYKIEKSKNNGGTLSSSTNERINNDDILRKKFTKTKPKSPLRTYGSCRSEHNSNSYYYKNRYTADQWDLD